MTPLRHSRPNLQQYVVWLKAVPWQVFCTFTFAWHISDVRAVGVFEEFVNRLERSVRVPVAYVRGDEKRFSGCGIPGAPRHFHVLLATHRKLDPHFVADLWMSMAGRRENGAGAHVRVYDPLLGGIAYVLKFIFEPEGDWEIRNLDLFIDQPARREMNHRQRRRVSRQRRREEEYWRAENLGSKGENGLASELEPSMGGAE